MPAKLTNKQRKLVLLISDNFGLGKPAKSLYDLMIEAGYEESSAKQQTEILSRLKGKITNVVDEIFEHRAEVMEEMRLKFKDAPYHHLVEGFDKLTKNHQLLTGGATSNIAIGVKKLTDEELQKLTEGK